MDPLTMSLLAGAGTAIGALPDIIPSKYERDQKKRLREMQRKQEMGALGLTEQQRSAIESQMRGARQQAQQYADAERARLTQPTAQPQMALLGQQMQDESRQRLEADLASQILNMDLQRQAEQEQEIKDLEAAQAQYRRARAEGLTAPFQAGAEAYVGQMGLERMISGMPPEQQQKALELMFLKQLGQRANSFGQSLYQGVQNAFASNPFALDADEISLRQAMSMKKPIKIKRPIESYSYDEMREMGMSDDEIQMLFEGVEIPTLGVKASDVANSTFGMY